MSLLKFINNLEKATNKIKDYTNKSIEKKGSTIVHPEVYSTLEEAKKASSDFNFRALHSTQKEFNRLKKGI